MNLKHFYISKNSLSTHFLLNWKLILFFLLVWTFFVSLYIFAFSDSGNGLGYFIKDAEYRTYQKTKFDEKDIYTIANSSSGASLCSVAVYTFGAFGFIIFAIAGLSLSFINIRGEIKNNSINYWMTTGLTRIQIFFSKLIFIWISLIIIDFPAAVIWLIRSYGAWDADGSDVWLVFSKNIYVLLLAIFLSTLFSFIMLITYKINAVDLILCISIIGYIISVELILVFPNIPHWVKYISPLNLCLNTYWYPDINPHLIGIENNHAIDPNINWPFPHSQYVHGMEYYKIAVPSDLHSNKKNLIWSPIALISLTTITSSVSTYVFKRIDLNI